MKDLASESASMQYSEFEPTPELKPWIAAYWHFRVHPEAGVIEHWIPPTGGATLVFPRSAPTVIVGPRISPHRIHVHGGDVFWGIHFWPGTAASLVGAQLGTFREQQGSAREVLGGHWTDALDEELARCDSEASAVVGLDRELLALIPRATPLDDKVLTAVFRLLAQGGHLPVGDLASGVGLSPRQLRRRFRQATGLTLKELARIQRTRVSAVAVVSAERERWVDLAADRGFSDQAHLVREFRQILGLTPVAFSDYVGRIQHGRLVR